jgi:hypothetical protein
MSNSGRHSLSDWLTLHELDVVTCRGLLEAAAQEGADGSRPTPPLSIEGKVFDPEAAWTRAAEAMRQFLPGHNVIIDEIYKHTVRVMLNSRGTRKKALTVDNGPTSYPAIFFRHSNEPSDALIVAHEFGHALQLRASQGRFVPPVMREVCAFISEATLLAHAQHNSDADWLDLSITWQKDDRRYFGSRLESLEQALPRMETPYSYAWNYPIARYLASRLRILYFPDMIWRAFEGRLSLREVVYELKLLP